MAWRLANSIEQLRAAIDKMAPQRSKSSDGTIGDAAHASRSSDHNPHVRDGSMGVVTAIDITHDPAHGVDAGAIADALVAARDPRVKYIIWNRRICSSTSQPWQWRSYSGKNPHTKHVHISVKAVKSRYDDTTLLWPLPGMTSPPASAESTAPASADERPTLRRGSQGDAVRELQQLLGVTQDGSFGPKTEAAVKQRQRQAGLRADGVVGSYTWDALLAS